MNKHLLIVLAGALTLGAGVLGCEPAAEEETEPPTRVEAVPAPSGWRQHEMNRPRPDAVTPVDQNLPAPVPADAVVLFGGQDLSAWQTPDGNPAPWKVENGYFEVAPGTGMIETKDSFGDVQLHVEWASPNPPVGTGQDRGNSGVFFMERYEVQVLDSYNAETYADGQAGAIYGQYPPLFNAARAPGEWQAYDIYFRRPRFEGGQVTEPARITVVLNGIVVQNNEVILGPTEWLRFAPYSAHENALPIQLQDHGHAVRFRNMWVRNLPERIAPDQAYLAAIAPVPMTTEELERHAGTFKMGEDENAPDITITREDDHLQIQFPYRPSALTMVPVGEHEFALTETAGTILYDTDAEGNPTGLTFRLGGAEMPARRVQ